MSNITVVTAFYDIGRGDWSHYKRTTDEYFQWFNNLATLENNMIIFTSKEYSDRIKTIRGNKPTTVIELDIFTEFKDYIKDIESIHCLDEFKLKIRQDLRINPEYVNSKYTLINIVKPFLLLYAKTNCELNSTHIAWVDFGMARSIETLNGIKQWSYNFDDDKINIFNFKRIDNYLDIVQTISNNIINTIGTYFVVPISMVELFWEETQKSIKTLIEEYRMIDDDQSVTAFTCSRNLNMFNQNMLPENCWFELFKRFSIHG